MPFKKSWPTVGKVYYLPLRVRRDAPAWQHKKSALKSAQLASVVIFIRTVLYYNAWKSIGSQVMPFPLNLGAVIGYWFHEVRLLTELMTLWSGKGIWEVLHVQLFYSFVLQLAH